MQHVLRDDGMCRPEVNPCMRHDVKTPCLQLAIWTSCTQAGRSSTQQSCPDDVASLLLCRNGESEVAKSRLGQVQTSCVVHCRLSGHSGFTPEGFEADSQCAVWLHGGHGLPPAERGPG